MPAAVHPNRGDRTDFAKGVFADDRVVRAIIERATAPVGTTSGSGFAAELTENVVGDFLGTLAPLSAAAALYAAGMQVQLGRSLGMKLPAREGAPSTTTAWVGEADPIPVRSYELNDDCELSPRKHGFIIGMSREAARRVGGETVIRTLIREDAAATFDGAVFSNDAGTDTVHAGMLDGLFALTGYGGGDRTAIEYDLSALSDIVSAAGSGNVTFIVSPRRAAKFRIIAPEIAREITMLPSLAVADDRIIAVDPASWAWGTGGDFDLDVSPYAAVHMSDEPLEIVADNGTVADPVRSYFQTDALAYRFLADVSFAARRPNAVAFLDDATW